MSPVHYSLSPVLWEEIKMSLKDKFFTKGVFQYSQAILFMLWLQWSDAKSSQLYILRRILFYNSFRFSNKKSEDSNMLISLVLTAYLITVHFLQLMNWYWIIMNR